MNELINKLNDCGVDKIIENELLSKHTTWKIGGPADLFIEPINKEGLIKILKVLKDYQISWKVIGKGSNLLVSDKGFRGAIISLNKEFQNILIEDTFINVGASSSLIRLANLAAKQGLTGLEFAGGIPGSVGGAIYMNAGAHGSDFSKILQEAEILLGNGDIVKWELNDFNFSYRYSILQEKKGIILSTLLKLNHGDRKKIAEDMANFMDRRKKTQPYHLPCSGSVFRNPKGDYAARLIEQLGLKGFQIGGAQVSTIHANFIVNVGQASAKDVLTLIEYVKQRVYEDYKLILVTEVELVGEK